MGRPKSSMWEHRPRLHGELMLGTRLAAAKLSDRHENVIRRHCEPIACDLETHALLYDLDQAVAALRDLPRREKPLAPIGGDTPNGSPLLDTAALGSPYSQYHPCL